MNYTSLYSLPRPFSLTASRDCGLAVILLFTLALFAEDPAYGQEATRSEKNILFAQGELAQDDSTLESGHYYDLYEVQVGEGHRLMVDMRADSLDTYLIVLSPAGDRSENDDYAGSTRRSRVEVTAYEEGSWKIFVTTYARKRTGTYSMSVAVDTTMVMSYKFLKAAHKGSVERLTALLESGGADVVNATDEDGRTALMEMAERGRRDVITRLIDWGANVNAADRQGRTALMEAANYGRSETVRHLLARQADVNATDREGRTALMEAARSGYTKTVALLLEQGAEVDTTDSQGRTALMDAVEYGRSETVRQLLAQGANINAADKAGRTALVEAVEYRYIELVEQLIDQGAEVNGAGETGLSPLVVAASRGDTATVALLITKGADVNAADHRGRTALLYAAEEGRAETVALLIAGGADVNAIDRSGRTALVEAVGYGYLELVEQLIDQGAEVNGAGETGLSPLVVATSLGDTAAVALLITKGADVNAADGQGSTALIAAVRGGYTEIVALLIAEGADVYAVDPGGHTALTHAARAGHKAMVEMFSAQVNRDDIQIYSGDLASGDSTRQNNAYYDAYEVETSAGERLVIDLISADFDTYLIVTPPGGEQIVNDDFGSTSVSHVDGGAREGGVWQIDVSSFSAEKTGFYTLHVEIDTTTVIAYQFLQAARAEDTTEVRRLMEQHADIDVRAVLTQAASEGDSPAVDVLLNVLQQEQGANDLSMASLLDQVAVPFQKRSAYDAALTYFERALRIREQALGTEHPDIVVSLYNLAQVYARQRNYAGIATQYERALQIREQTQDAEPLDVARTLQILAQAYAEQGKYENALPFHQQALQIREEEQGSEHPKVLTTLLLLAQMYQALGDTVAAKAYDERVSQARRTKRGPPQSMVGGADAGRMRDGELTGVRGAMTAITVSFDPAIFREILGYNVPSLGWGYEELVSIEPGWLSEASSLDDLPRAEEAFLAHLIEPPIESRDPLGLGRVKSSRLVASYPINVLSSRALPELRSRGRSRGLLIEPLYAVGQVALAVQRDSTTVVEFNIYERLDSPLLSLISYEPTPSRQSRHQLPASAQPSSPSDEPVVVRRYPTMVAPEQVLPERVFAVLVSLGEDQTTPAVAVEGQRVTPEGKVALPDRDSWIIEVILSAPDFTIRDGANIAYLELPREGNPSPAIFRLHSTPGVDLPHSTKLTAFLYHEGQLLARVTREITVRDTARVDIGDLPGPGNRKPYSSTPAIAFNLNNNPPPNLTRALEEPNEDHTPLSPLVPKATDAPPKEDWIEWSKSETPDLTVQIIEESDLLIISSPYLDRTNPYTYNPPEIAAWLEEYYRDFENATPRSRSKGARRRGRGRIDYTMKGFGKRLYERAPEAFKKAFWGLKDLLGSEFDTILIHSDSPLLPWELMRPTSDGGEESDFLGVKFKIARWHSNHDAEQRTRPRLPLKELIVIAPSYEGSLSLPHQPSELQALQQIDGYRRFPGRLDSLENLFRTSPQGIIHFAGHAQVDTTNRERIRYSLLLEEGEVLDLVAWEGITPHRFRTPLLVFFNACESGEVHKVAGFFDGWATSLLKAGAIGYIGGLWSLGDKGASEFARHFYEKLQEGLQRDGSVLIADILRQTREFFYLNKNKDPTYLGYVFYGDPYLQVVNNGGS